MEHLPCTVLLHCAASCSFKTGISLRQHGCSASPACPVRLHIEVIRQTSIAASEAAHLISVFRLLERLLVRTVKAGLTKRRVANKIDKPFDLPLQLIRSHSCRKNHSLPILCLKQARRGILRVQKWMLIAAHKDCTICNSKKRNQCFAQMRKIRGCERLCMKYDLRAASFALIPQGFRPTIKCRRNLHYSNPSQHRAFCGPIFRLCQPGNQ